MSESIESEHFIVFTAGTSGEIDSERTECSATAKHLRAAV